MSFTSSVAYNHIVFIVQMLDKLIHTSKPYKLTQLRY
jgi:hypothetical protein